MMQSLRNLTIWSIRIGIGLVLLYSGMIKVARPYDFLNSVFQYQLLGPQAATLFAGVLPFVEMTLGVALLSGICTMGAACLAALLFAIFSVGQSSILLRGISADCGCFGAGEPVGWMSLLRTLGLLAAALICFVSSIRPAASGIQEVRQHVLKKGLSSLPPASITS